MREFPASPITALIDQTPHYYLGESMGLDLTVAELLGPAGLAELAGVGVGYRTSAGDPGLRALVAARHGAEPGQVLITAGAAAALFTVALVCGDGEILVGRPCYPPMFDALQGLGASVVTVQSRFDDGYRLDLGAFAAGLSPRTGLVMVASPQNPSGVRLTETEVDGMLAAMAGICPDAVLLVDETFREATYGDGPPAASFAGRSPRLLTCGSLSKAHGAPGLRIGWLIGGGPGLYEQLRRARFNSSLCCGAIDEYLATALLGRADQVLAARGAALAQARDIVERWVKAHTGRLRWLRPEAGAFCCVQLAPGTSAERFHAYLAEQKVQVAQGPWFGDGADIVRVGLAYESPDRLAEGLALISAALGAAQE